MFLPYKNILIYKVGLLILSCLLFNSSIKLVNLDLKQDLVIGSGSDKVFFSTNIKIEADSNGNIYVTDWKTYGFRVFNSEGQLIQTVGRRGKGPGEFERPRSLNVDASGNVYVFDSTLFRYNVFNAKNKYELMHTGYVPNINSGTFQRTGFHPFEMFLFKKSKSFLLSYSAPYTPGTGDLNREVKLVLFDNEGEIVTDHFLSLPASDVLISDRGGNLTVGTHPLGKKPHFKLGNNDLIYAGWPDELKIEVYNRHKEHIRDITHPVEKVKISSAQIDEVSKRFKSFSKSTIKQQTPEYMPVYDWFVVDDEHRVWVAVNTENLNEYSMYIFDNEGKLICKMILSRSVELKTIRNGYAYGVSEGEYGEQSVVRFKIVTN